MTWFVLEVLSVLIVVQIESIVSEFGLDNVEKVAEISHAHLKGSNPLCGVTEVVTIKLLCIHT